MLCTDKNSYDLTIQEIYKWVGHIVHDMPRIAMLGVLIYKERL